MEIRLIQNENDGFYGLEEWLQSPSHKFEKMYVSFGGKLNSRSIQFSYPETIRNRHYDTNANYQMIPAFIRHQRTDTAKNLVIVIDDFHQQKSLEKNIKYLETEMKIQKIDHVAVLFINKQLSSINITNCLSVVIHFIEKQQIQLKDIMFANYICFKHPNEHEDRVEKNICSSISRTLKTIGDGIYESRFYQWYGMRFYCYDYLYLYNDYKLVRDLDMMKLQSQVFQQVLCNEPLDTIEYESIQMFLESQTPSLQNAWSNFQQYTVNIVEDYILE